MSSSTRSPRRGDRAPGLRGQGAGGEFPRCGRATHRSRARARRLRTDPVRDDGIGISREEIALALSRHATSKIASLSDLERWRRWISRRGAAEHSVVSRLSLTSRSKDAEHAGMWMHAMASQARHRRSHPPAPASKCGLFFNVPAAANPARGEHRIPTHSAHAERLACRGSRSASRLRITAKHLDAASGALRGAARTRGENLRRAVRGACDRASSADGNAQCVGWLHCRPSRAANPICSSPF